MQIHIHRFGVFRPDGTARLYGIHCWTGVAEKRPPPVLSTDEEPALYVVSLDAELDHWHRLQAEAWAMGHEDERVRAAAHVGHLRHSGGTPHPRFAHAQLGGTLTWARTPHPVVAARATEVAGWDATQLARHFAGTDFKEA